VIGLPRTTDTKAFDMGSSTEGMGLPGWRHDETQFVAA